MKDYQTGAEKLTVYTDIPGYAAHQAAYVSGKKYGTYETPIVSPHYEIWVRSAATDQQWVKAFANFTYNRASELPEIPQDGGNVQAAVVQAYQKHTRRWSHTYANIEMSGNSPVEVEIRKISGISLNGSTSFVKSAVHPVQKTDAGSHRIENNRVYFQISNPGQFVIDINGQMDDRNAAIDAWQEVHAVTLFANPILEKPVEGPSNRIHYINPRPPGTYSELVIPAASTYDELVFRPGVHQLGMHFDILPGKKYYIPGDAILYGNLSNSQSPSTGFRSKGDSITIYGYGTLSGVRIPHYQYNVNNATYPISQYHGAYSDKGITIQDSADLTLNGITVVDPSNFCTDIGTASISGASNICKWIKLISWRANGDGYGGWPQLTDSFIRASDDATYVNSNRIRCTFWKDTNANIFKIPNLNPGDSRTVADCDVIYARLRDYSGNLGQVFSLHTGYTGLVALGNVTFKDIRFHDRRSNMSIISLGAERSYTGLRFENIQMIESATGKKNSITGTAQAPWYASPILKNITIAPRTGGGAPVTLNAANFDTYFNRNEYVDFLLFDDPRDLTLTLNANPAMGSVTKSPDTATYKEMSLVTLTAVPEANHVFTGWEGLGINAANANTNPLTMRITDNGTITARFSPNFNITNRFTTPGTHDWVCPPGVGKVTIECRGGGGAGGSVKSTGNGNRARSGGGAGGSYAKKVIHVVPGNLHKVIVGAGGVPVTAVTVHNTALPQQTGGASKFTDSAFTVPEIVLATGGVGGNNAMKSTSSVNAAGGIGSASGCIGDVVFAGGNGGTPNGTSNTGGAGAGGGGAGNANAGGNATTVSGIGLGGLAGGGDGGQGRGAVGGGSTAGPTAPGGASGGVNADAANTEYFSGPGVLGEVALTYIQGLDHFEVTAASPQTAGVPFDVTITAKDATNATVFGSLDFLTVTSPGDNLMEFDWNGDGVYGDNSGVMIDGVKILKARNKRAETVTLVAAAELFTTSPACNVTITPAAFSKLQILLPGETAAPGTATGKTGNPSHQGIGIAFDITVNAVDAFWNLIATVTDTVSITSSDPAASPPANAPLVGGRRTFTITHNSVGGFFLTATNLTTGTQSPATSASMTVQGFTWMGDGAANRWTIDPAALNWTEPSGISAAYTDGRLVNFNDSSANLNVDIEGSVTPGSITVESSKNYAIGSTSGGSIGGSSGLTKAGTGTLTLNSANSYSGNTLVNAGSLRAGNNQAFGSSGTVTLGNTSAALELADGITISRNLTVSNTGDRKSLALQTGAASASYSGIITNSETTVGNFEVDVGDLGTMTLSSAVAGNTLTKTGTGLLVLSGSTDNAGLILDATAGEVRLGKDAVPGVRAVSGIRRIADGATVKLTGAGTDQIFGGSSAGQGVNGIEEGGTLNLNGKSESISYLAGTGGVVDGGSGAPVLTVGESNAVSWFAGEILNTSGSLSLVKVGSAEFSLTGANSYSGSTEIRQGRLTVVQGDDRLPPSTALILGSGTNSATLRLGSANTLTPPLGTVSNQILASLTTSGTGTANAVVGGNHLNISTLTLNNNSDVTYGGRLGGSGSHENRLALTKTGSGTFTLTGTRTYTGPTIVEAGTLALVGGSHASPITVKAGASLGFTLGSPATSTAAVDLTAGTVKITGTVDKVSNYKLMTASSFTGPLVLSQAIPGYSLALQGAGNTELWLVFSDLYEAWSGIGVNFDGDANDDGVEDGLAWFLGAGSPDENAAARLPKPTQIAGAMVLEFDCLNATDRDTAVFEVQYSSDLGQTNTWAGTIIPGETGTFTGGGVDFVITDPEPAGGLLKVVATIPQGEAAVGKLFGRIRGVK
jgi:autotransporter-associated beta strand protein